MEIFIQSYVSFWEIYISTTNSSELIVSETHILEKGKSIWYVILDQLFIILIQWIWICSTSAAL